MLMGVARGDPRGGPASGGGPVRNGSTIRSRDQMPAVTPITPPISQTEPLQAQPSDRVDPGPIRIGATISAAMVVALDAHPDRPSQQGPIIRLVDHGRLRRMVLLLTGEIAQSTGHRAQCQPLLNSEVNEESRETRSPHTERRASYACLSEGEAVRRPRLPVALLYRASGQNPVYRPFLLARQLKVE